ncbi:MAG: hypothetical protein P1U44_04555 [Vicingaceae bacterium]|nr:hypothetical protein [Vicingaceae bacterium]
MGANVIRKTEFDKVNNEKQVLLNKTKDIEKIRIKLLYTECKLQAFIQYHRQWKPTTRNFQNRLSKLKKENLYISFTNYPSDIADNLKEAYNCYINGLPMACYIMILRTIEITANLIYEQSNPIQFNNKGKPIFIPALQKLNWVKTNKMIGGADYTLAKAFIEARNDSVHEIFTPTEKQLMSAFEAVINLVLKLQINIKK